MVHQLGGPILLILAVAAFGSLLSGEVARTWDARWPQTRPSRRQAVSWGASQARSAARAGASWGRARLAGSRLAPWLPAAAAGGDDGPGPEPCESCGAREAVSCGLCGICITEAESDAESDAGPGPAPPPGKVVQGAVITGEDDPDAAPATPAEHQPATGGNPVMTTQATAVPGAEEMAAGLARLRAWAVAGNMEQKEAAFAALAEAWAQDSATIDALGKSMQEDDKYGPEITEPVAAMARSLTALSTRAAELEGTISARLAMSNRDQIRSGYQAPERHQVQEAGAR